MNYFTHALPFLLDDPHFMAGTAVPDWMSVADRQVRVRERLAEPVAEGIETDDVTRAVARGALQHLHDDGWFHRTRGFHEVTGSVTQSFRAVAGTDDPMRCSFLGHVVTELLLDSALIELYPQGLDRYYTQLKLVDPLVIQSAVNQIARGETDRLAQFLPLFLKERFLYDYGEDSRMLYRLNGVLHRVKLPRLTEEFLPVICTARELVRSQVNELLPAEHYLWERVSLVQQSLEVAPIPTRPIDAVDGL